MKNREKRIIALGSFVVLGSVLLALATPFPAQAGPEVTVVAPSRALPHRAAEERDPAAG